MTAGAAFTPKGAGAMRITGLILAGGEGRRMGGTDKALILLHGRNLLSHVAERFGPQVEALALSANGEPGRFTDWPWPVLADAGHARLGPMAGLLAGLEWAAARGASHLATVSVDTPFLPGDLVVRLVAGCAAPDDCAIAESHGRTHPTCGLWPVTRRAALAGVLAAGERRLGQWAHAQGAVRVSFSGDPDPFFNLNTPADLAEAEGWLARG